MSPARKSPSAQSILNIKQSLAKEILPVYYFFGEDIFTIDKTIIEVKKHCGKLVESDFDNETISCDKNLKVEDILELASTFPFGGGKKVIVVRNFEVIKDKKKLADYAFNPVDSTILIIAHYGKQKAISSEPFSTLYKKNFLFEAKELKGYEWANWLKREAEEEGIVLPDSSAQLLVDIVGESKHLLQMHLPKLREFIGDKKTVSESDIMEIASKTREYNIFQFLDSIGSGDKQKSILIAFNLIDQGYELLNLLGMLTKYISIVAHSIELDELKIPDMEAAKKIDVNYYFYINCKKGKYFRNHYRLANAAKVLLEADLAIKSTSLEAKNFLTSLIAKLIPDDKISHQ